MPVDSTRDGIILLFINWRNGFPRAPYVVFLILWAVQMMLWHLLPHVELMAAIHGLVRVAGALIPVPKQVSHEQAQFKTFSELICCPKQRDRPNIHQNRTISPPMLRARSRNVP